MDANSAEIIINKYGAAIAEPKYGIYRLSSLPCSKAKIKQAYFTYIAAIYNEQGFLSDEFMQPLLTCYYMLNQFVDDETADRLENTMRLDEAGKLDYKNNANHKKLIQEYLNYHIGDGEKHEGGIVDGNLVDEINEFIEELYKSEK